MVSWVIEHSFSDKDFDTMCSHIVARGMPLHVVKIIPFLHKLEGETPKVDGPCVAYGRIGIEAQCKQNGWTPGIFGDLKRLSEYEANRHLRELYLNHDQIVTPIKSLGNSLESFARLLGHRDNPVEAFFIKPNTDTKQFVGHVVKVADFHAWYKGMIKSGYLDDNDFNVVISRPKKLGCEWRIFMVDGKISSYSIYRQYQTVMPERLIIPEVEELVMKAHELYQPASVYVVDIAQLYLENGDVEFRVVEYNSVNSAGFYACDIPKIIDDISEYVDRL